MPSFLKKVGKALKKRIGGDMPPDVKKAYEAEKHKGLLEGAKTAGREAGRTQGRALGKGRSFGNIRNLLADIGQGAANVLESDEFGLGLKPQRGKRRKKKKRNDPFGLF